MCRPALSVTPNHGGELGATPMTGELTLGGDVSPPADQEGLNERSNAPNVKDALTLRCVYARSAPSRYPPGHLVNTSGGVPTTKGAILLGGTGPLPLRGDERNYCVKLHEDFSSAK